MDQLSAGLIGEAPKLQARVITVEGLVAAVDGGQIVLNVGAKTGLRVGNQMSVMRITSVIKDPATGNIIRRMTSPVGVIEITDVDDVSAVGKIVSGNGFKVGDSVKTNTQ